DRNSAKKNGCHDASRFKKITCEIHRSANSVLRKVSAAVEGQLFGRGNEISCRPPARSLPLYRRRSFACPVSLCVRPRLTSEQTRHRLFHNRRGPSRFLPPAPSNHRRTCAPDLCVRKMAKPSIPPCHHTPQSASSPEAKLRCALHPGAFLFGDSQARSGPAREAAAYQLSAAFGGCS